MRSTADEEGMKGGSGEWRTCVVVEAGWMFETACPKVRNRRARRSGVGGRRDRRIQKKERRQRAKKGKRATTAVRGGCWRYLCWCLPWCWSWCWQRALQGVGEGRLKKRGEETVGLAWTGHSGGCSLETLLRGRAASSGAGASQGLPR